MDVDPERRLHPIADLSDDAAHVLGEHAAVGVTEHEPLGAGFLGGRQHAKCELPVPPVPVEEVLRVEEHVPALITEEPDRVFHHGDALLEGRPERLGHVKIPRFPDEAHDARLGLQEVTEHGTVLSALAGLAGHPEGGQGRLLQRLLRGQAEELRLAGVRSRPSALDEREPGLIEFVKDPQTILDREGQAGALGSVPERGVVQLDVRARRYRGESHRVAPSATRSPTSDVE